MDDAPGNEKFIHSFSGLLLGHKTPPAMAPRHQFKASFVPVLRKNDLMSTKINARLKFSGLHRALGLVLGLGLGFGKLG